jgi:death on curing protein
VAAPEPRWLSREEVDALHFELIRLYGGAYGIRDDDLIESALARPINRWVYEQAEIPQLAAAYGYGLARNHGYVDGNKRIAFAALTISLLHNGFELVAAEDEAITTMEALAAGNISEEELGRWIVSNIRSPSDE